MTLRARKERTKLLMPSEPTYLICLVTKLRCSCSLLKDTREETARRSERETFTTPPLRFAFDLNALLQ